MDEDDGFVRAPRRWRVLIGGAAAVAVLAVAATVGVGVLRSTGAEPVRVAPVATPSPTALYVHVSGAVRSPGLYPIAPGARVADAVAAAGGFADDAEQNSVNLARAVEDGEQITVTAVGAPPPAGIAGASTGPLDLNSATAEQLEELPRIGPALAERIVTWRDENGRFSRVDDLLEVSGIGEKMLSTIRELVRT